MSYTNGVFSYQYRNSFFTFAFDGKIEGRITRVDANIARLFFETRDAENNVTTVPVPDKLIMREFAVGETIPPINNEFFLFAFGGTYVLEFDGNTILRLTPSRQQDIYVTFRNLPKGSDVDKFHAQGPDWKMVNAPGVGDDSDAPAELSEMLLMRLASAISLRFDKSMDTYNKALEMLKSYKIADFINNLDLEWPDKNALQTRMYDIVYNKKQSQYTLEEVVWAEYCMKVTNEGTFSSKPLTAFTAFTVACTSATVG
jgi:hypothetical protein